MKLDTENSPNPQEQRTVQAKLETLELRLHSSFDANPVEDGITHSAEQIIEQTLRSGDEELVCRWLAQMSVDAERPVFAASVLRCLGRLTVGNPTWRARVVRDTLASRDIEMRDAAVQAAEWWGDQKLKRVLQLHSESEPWLREYIEGVVDSFDG